MKPWFYNMIAIVVGTIFVLACAGALLALMFVGSAFRMSNVTQLDVLSPANLKATVALFGVSAAVVIGGLVLCAWLASRRRG
jgi:hypothetical protein